MYFEPVLEIILLLSTLRKKRSGAFGKKTGFSVEMKSEDIYCGSKQLCFCVVIKIL